MNTRLYLSRIFIFSLIFSLSSHLAFAQVGSESGGIMAAHAVTQPLTAVLLAVAVMEAAEVSRTALVPMTPQHRIQMASADYFAVTRV